MKVITDSWGEKKLAMDSNVEEISAYLKAHPAVVESRKTTNLLLLGLYSALLDIQDMLSADPARIMKLQKIIEEFSDETKV